MWKEKLEDWSIHCGYCMSHEFIGHIEECINADKVIYDLELLSDSKLEKFVS